MKSKKRKYDTVKKELRKVKDAISLNLLECKRK